MPTMFKFASALRRAVDHPERDGGRWLIYVGARRKLCPNLATAEAWAKYLHRQGIPWSAMSVERAEPMPGFPVGEE